MMRYKSRCWILLLVLSVFLATTNADAQDAPPKAKKAAKGAKAAKPPSPPPVPPPDFTLEPKAIEILKTACSRLAAAKSMVFTAVVAYESPSRLGPPLVYTTKSEVTMQRPDKLRVITPGDGPASEFYYDGKIMMAFEPAANLVAITEAPPTLDAMLQAAYDAAAVYFPFTDVIVADPYQDLSEGLKLAFYMGQSQIVGGTTTDMIAFANEAIFVQMWIGTEDKLPRRVRAVFRDDPARLRHQLELSNWQLDTPVAAEAFGSAKANSATRIQFARPDPQLPPGLSLPVQGRPALKSKTAQKPGKEGE
jgi:hypothetical protein